MSEPGARPRLSRERVLEAASDLADRAGLDALTMRKLAAELGVEPMSLYHHVASKDDILDGMVDRVFGEIDLPTPGGAWKPEMRRRAVSARHVLTRHPWAPALMDSRRNPGPATIRHHEACIATLRRDGFSIPMTAHALSLIDSYVYGFSISEAALPMEGPEDLAELSEAILATHGADHPHVAEFIIEHALAPGYDYGDEFEWGLDRLLDALEIAATP